MIKYLVKECNANVNGESSVVVGLASGGSSKRLRVLEHPLALIYPTQTYLLRSFLNNKTSSKPCFFDIFSPSNFIRPRLVFAALVAMSELILALE